MSVKAVAENRITMNYYKNIHAWVATKLGKPSTCERCGNTRVKPYYYDWANISGEYKKDLSDWQRLCKPCHRIVDGRISTREYCKNGHKLSEVGQHKGECLICKRERDRIKSWERRRRIGLKGHWNARRTHCPRGHEYTTANTYRPPKRPNHRDCLACRRMAAIEHKSRHDL